MASICGSPVCAGGKPKLKFTYTGDYVVRKDGVVELLTSGTLMFLNPAVIDIFCVGVGGGGNVNAYGSTSASQPGGGGGGGLYTASSDTTGGTITINGASGGSGIVCFRLAA